MLSSGQRIGLLAWSLLTIGLAVFLVWSQLRGPAPQVFTQPHRATIVLPEGVALSSEGFPATRLAISPDGRQLAFVGVTDRGPMIFLQGLNETVPRSIEGSEGAAAPFWSPDSRVLAFERSDRIVKLDVSGSGGVTDIGNVNGIGTWLTGPPEEAVILTTSMRTQGAGIRSFSRRSGATTIALPAQPSEIFVYASSLFDGRHVLFTVLDAGEASPAGVYVGPLGTTEKTLLLPLDPTLDQINASYASGHLLTVRDETIVARPFDRATMTVGSATTEIAGPVFALPRGGAAFSVSQNGVLAYESRSRTDRSRLVVYDRKGTLLRTLGDDAGYSNVELSPDGSQIAVSVPDGTTRNRDIWVVDVVRGLRSRVTFDPSDERSAMWSPDGKSLVFTSKGLDLYAKTIGVATEAAFVKDGVSKDPRGWSPNGEVFIYRASGATTRNDLWIKPRDPQQQPYPFLATPFDENYATFSPDGRWLAYASNESGRSEIYATSFPSGEGKWQISTSGGMFPRWRRDGKEIVYLSTDNTLMSVSINGTGSALEVPAADMLFQVNVAPGPGDPFDLTPDGQRFIVNTALPAAAPPSIVVLYNWPELINKR